MTSAAHLVRETYDQNGNVTATGGKAFSYDSENHLTSMNSGAVTLVYDGDGNRVAKTVGGVTTYYLVDDLNPTGYAQVVDELTGGSVSRQYTYGLQRIRQQQEISSAWTPSFYGYDGGGTVRNLTDSSGTVTDSYEYDAFGNHWTVEGSTPNNMLYQGEEWDPDLSLVYLRARYMNPLTGRFLSRDPEDGIDTDPKTLHKYIYADGDPINLSDPTGRATTALPMPGRASVGGGDLGEYALVVLAVGLGTVAADKEVACALNTAYDVLAKTVGSGFQKVAIPEPDQCKAECPPCDPPSGTQCYEPEWGGRPHHIWKDYHFQIWQQNQNPKTCKCFWDRKHGPGGATGDYPDDMNDCLEYPSWPNN
jgi:RHS repeat-associated protein